MGGALAAILLVGAARAAILLVGAAQAEILLVGRRQRGPRQAAEVAPQGFIAQNHSEDP